ncbi:MAG: glycosyltransferase family 2 protein [Clostridia bacterium]|nr:glycosyltransferase family 2 protein [Clostridia bacterium]
MSAPKVSVVIPVYNCEKYLQACIDSLLGQTLHDMEFLFVCDASPDNSLAILRENERRDARIRVIAFPENRGVSAARNAGVEAAQGEYIGFCDSDDWVEPQMYGALYDLAKEKDAQITFCRVYKDYERADGSVRRDDVPLGFETGMRFDHAAIRDTLVPAMLSKEKDSDELPLSGYTPRNLFAAPLAKAHAFRPDIRYAEDLLYIVECMLDADAAAALDVAYYHYRFHGGSVTKRYSPHVPDSHDKSNDALDALFGDLPSCRARMTVRRRKMAVTAVRNYCFPGSPYGFMERVRQVRAYMRREDVRAWFAPVRPFDFPPKLAVRLFLMKHRMALIMCLLFTYVFDRV